MTLLRRSDTSTPVVVDDESRCAVCGDPLACDPPRCTRGQCASRPLPPRFYAPVRAGLESGRMVLMHAHGHRFIDRSAQSLAETARAVGRNS